MSDAPAFVAIPVWIDAPTVVADVLATLRMAPTDVDAPRITEMVATSAALVATFLDRPEDDQLPAAPPMDYRVRAAMAQVTIELFRRKDAPFGVLNAWSPDEIAVRINTDPLRGSYHLLLPLKLGFGARW